MPLQIAFSTRSVRELCESDSRAVTELGSRVARKLKGRLSDLRAATSIGDLVAPRIIEIGDPRSNQIGIDLCDGYRMLVCANHPSNPTGESGSVDWSKVSRIKIMEIENEND
jgi:proteic killer suppression protein